MQYLKLSEVLELQRRVIDESGGSRGLLDFGRVQSAVAQPRMAFGGQELYPSIEEKAAALCYSLIQGHAFVDGNKRIGHAAMEVFLLLNGFEINAGVDDQESLILGIASSEIERSHLVDWLRAHIAPTA